jgi:NAD(P)-dependent dehydrogenase (short-subunit alcohol dehydrogenase family)
MKKKILIVGASGTLGSAIASALSAHDIIRGGRSGGDVQIDITDAQSILGAFKKIGRVDAVVSAAGHVSFAPLVDFKAEPIGESLHTKGLTDKLMGQVNLALAARDSLNDGGSITLTTGILAEQFISQGSSASMINNAVEGFVKASAIEMPRGIRINVVSPSVFEESMKKYGAFFAGFRPVPVSDAARAFVRSVEGLETGQVYKVF